MACGMCLYNASCVGESNLMTLRSPGVLCPPVRLYSRLALIILLAAPAVLSQQQKSVPPTQKTLPSGQLDTKAEVNERIGQLAAASSVKQGDYVIGSGDLLAVEVFDVPELSRDVRVNESGLIPLPLIPVKVHAAGLTTFQLQDKLAELLQTNGLVSTPQVTVSLKEQHSQPITVSGAVKNPMVIQAIRQTTLLQALSQAGGIADDAGSTVIVTRPASPLAGLEDSDINNGVPGAGQTFTISLGDLLESGNSS